MWVLAVCLCVTVISKKLRHAWKDHHKVCVEDYETLDVEMSINERLYLEDFHMRSQSHPLNNDSGCLDPLYNVLIDKEEQ